MFRSLILFSKTKAFQFAFQILFKNRKNSLLTGQTVRFLRESLSQYWHADHISMECKNNQAFKYYILEKSACLPDLSVKYSLLVLF